MTHERTCANCGTMLSHRESELCLACEAKLPNNFGADEITGAESTSWTSGMPPLKRILLVWNSKAIFGPIAFATEEHRQREMDRVATAPGGPVTHYLIIPKV